MDLPKMDPGVLMVYALWDRKLQSFGALVCERNDGTMLRSLRDGLRGSGSVLEQHPDDFDVMQLGEYHPQTGFVSAVGGPPRLVVNVGLLLVPPAVAAD